jgi:hypothetical protein
MKDLCELIEKALLPWKGMDDDHAFDALVTKLNEEYGTNISGGGHLRRNIVHKLRSFLSNPANDDVGYTVRGELANGLSMLVNEKSYIEHYGRFNGSHIYNSKNGIVPFKRLELSHRATKPIETPHASVRTPVRIGFTILPDTVLQYHYVKSYSRHLEPIFIPTKDWKLSLDELIGDRVDLVLHNFPTVLKHYIESPHEALVFIPLFTFKGYKGVVRLKDFDKFRKAKAIQETSFEDWTSDLKREFLTSIKIIVPSRTDVEWVFKHYCEESLKIDYRSMLLNNIVSCEINPGRKTFLNKEEYALHITNTFHAIDLRKRNKKFDIILDGEKFTMHQNLNGFICRESYFNNNKDTIKEVINTWYNDINDFIKEKDMIISNDGEGEIHYYTKNLPKLLNEKLGTTVTLLELMKSYQSQNRFFTTPNEAFDYFSNEVLSKMEVRQRNFEIANIQAGNHSSEVNSNIIALIKEQTLKVRRALDFIA